MHKLDNLEQIFKKFKISKKFECFNQFWPNSIPEVLDRYIIFVCSFRKINRILWKSELPQKFFQKKCTKFQLDISNLLWVIVVWEVSNRAHTHIHLYTKNTHTLEITFLVVSNYSEYSDTEISNFFYENSFFNEPAKLGKFIKEF